MNLWIKVLLYAVQVGCISQLIMDNGELSLVKFGIVLVLMLAISATTISIVINVQKKEGNK